MKPKIITSVRLSGSGQEHRLKTNLKWVGKQLKIIVILIFVFGIPKMQAQQATVSSGGNAAGPGGTVSYSIGQVADKTQTGTTGTLTQGVQQPFEITTLSGSEFEDIKLEAVIFPNPAVFNITLKITNFDLQNLRYQLFEINGRLLDEGKISSQETIIEIGHYPAAAYFLRVSSNHKELKTFKIIKN